MPRFAKYHAMRAGKSHLHNMKCKCSKVDKVYWWVRCVLSLVSSVRSTIEDGLLPMQLLPETGKAGKEQGTRKRFMLT